MSRHLLSTLVKPLYWNMWNILGYLLNSSPQVFYQHILKRLNQALYWSDTCGLLCDSDKQLGWGCVLSHTEKSCNLQGRTLSSQGKLDKSRLMQHPVVPGGWVAVCVKCRSNCVAQMGALMTTESLSGGYSV